MTEQQHEPVGVVRVETPEQLASARQQAGLGTADVAQRLKLSVRQINTLEAGNWDALPGRPFVRGVIRSYGRLLNVDVTPLLESVGSAIDGDSLLNSRATLDAPMPRSGGFGFGDAGRMSPLTWAILGLAAVIALGLFFGRSADISDMRSWIGRDDSRDAGVGIGVPAPQPATDSQPLSSASQPPATLSAPLALAQPEPAPPGAASAPGLPGTPSLSGSPGSTVSTGMSNAPMPSAAAATPIRIASSSGAWVEIRQADGSIVYSGTLKAGVAEAVGGTTPFSLVIGNASSVTLEFQGKTIPLGSPASNVVRMKLP